MAKNNQIDALEQELNRWPGVEWDYAPKGNNKHPKLLVFFQNQRRKMSLAFTPSDHRTALNTVSDLRKLLRELGASRI
jgi:hypothetical protein